MAMPRIRTAATPTPCTVPVSGRNVEDWRWSVASAMSDYPQICSNFVAVVDFHGDRTYVRCMTAAEGDGWWEDDCPLPDVPLADLPDDPDPDLEPEDDIDEMLRAEKMR